MYRRTGTVPKDWYLWDIYIYHIVVICEVLAVTVRPARWTDAVSKVRSHSSDVRHHIVVMWFSSTSLFVTMGCPLFSYLLVPEAHSHSPFPPKLKFHINWQYNFIFRFCLCISIFHVKFDFICLNLMIKDWQIYFGSHMNLCFLSVSSRPELMKVKMQF